MRGIRHVDHLQTGVSVRDVCVRAGDRDSERTPRQRERTHDHRSQRVGEVDHLQTGLEAGNVGIGAGDGHGIRVTRS